MVIAMTGMMAATSAVRPWAARALFGLRRFDDPPAGARAQALQGAGYVWPNKASEPSDGPWQAYPYLSWHVYASARARADKLVPWFAGEE